MDLHSQIYELTEKHERQKYDVRKKEFISRIVKFI